MAVIEVTDYEGVIHKVEIHDVSYGRYTALPLVPAQDDISDVIRSIDNTTDLEGFTAKLVHQCYRAAMLFTVDLTTDDLLSAMQDSKQVN